MAATLAAIPTSYNGQRYRSRNEAQWAAFFTAMEWKFTYEPFGRYGPDWRIDGRCGFVAETRGTLEPMSTADEPPDAYETVFRDKYSRARMDWPGPFILMGGTPAMRFVNTTHGCREAGIAVPSRESRISPAWWARCSRCGQRGLTVMNRFTRIVPCGHQAQPITAVDYSVDVQPLWIRAGEIVRPSETRAFALLDERLF